MNKMVPIHTRCNIKSVEKSEYPGTKISRKCPIDSRVQKCNPSCYREGKMGSRPPHKYLRKLQNKRNVSLVSSDSHCDTFRDVPMQGRISDPVAPKRCFSGRLQQVDRTFQSFLIPGYYYYFHILFDTSCINVCTMHVHNIHAPCNRIYFVKYHWLNCLVFYQTSPEGIQSTFGDCKIREDCDRPFFVLSLKIDWFDFETYCSMSRLDSYG